MQIEGKDDGQPNSPAGASRAAAQSSAAMVPCLPAWTAWEPRPRSKTTAAAWRPIARPAPSITSGWLRHVRAHPRRSL